MTNIITIIMTAITMLFPVAKEFDEPQQRVMTGNYYDFGVINTIDGNDWLIYGANIYNAKEDTFYFISEFADVELQDGDLVQVVFDTKGTEDILDDEIIDIRTI